MPSLHFFVTICLPGWLTTVPFVASRSSSPDRVQAEQGEPQIYHHSPLQTQAIFMKKIGVNAFLFC